MVFNTSVLAAGSHAEGSGFRTERSGRGRGWVLLLALMLLGIVPGSGSLARAGEKQQKLPAMELLQRAHTSFAEGDFPAARKYYLEVLPSFPKNFDILKALGYCFYVTGPKGYAEAVTYYARAYRVNPRSNEVADKLWHCYMVLKQYQEAADVEMKVAQSPGSPAGAWKRAAQAYAKAGKTSQSSAAYQAYLQRAPSDLAARVSLARLDAQDKDYDGAAEQYRLVLAANPNFAPALTGLARILSWQGHLDRSLDLYERVLKYEPNNGEALSGKAYVLLWQKHYRQALSLFRRLRRRYPHDADVQRGMEAARRHIEAEAFATARQSGHVPRLLDYYREQVARNPHDLDALEALAAFSANAQHCNQSIVYGRRALRVSQGSAAAELALARSLRLCRSYREAISYYRQYLEAHPRAGDVLYELGDTLRRARRFPEALKVFQKLVQLNPGNLDAQVGLGQALAATGQYDEALTHFNQALAQQPNSYDALQGKAFVLFWKNDLQQAQRIFEVLAKTNPGDPQNAKALKEIARAEEQAKWEALRPSAKAPPQSWLEFYRKRLAADPHDRAAMKGLAYAESELNNTSAAIEAYRQVLEVYPQDRDSKLELARLLSLNRQYAPSISLYRQVLAEEPDDPVVLGSFGRVYTWAGEPQKALSIYRKLLVQDPTNTAYRLAEAKLEIQLKNYDSARKTLGYLLSEDPENRDARLELARIDIAQKQYEAALSNYDALLRNNPRDPAALLGKARMDYYRGKFVDAQSTATEAVKERPGDFSSVFLLASIEHAQGHRGKTLALLNRADKLSPGDPEVASLRNRTLSESRVTLRTTAAFAREIGPPSGYQGLANEDLRMYTYGTTIGLRLLPKTLSYLSFTSLPTDSPASGRVDSSGNRIPTGITGAAAPYEFLYRQSTRFGPRLTVRAGAGAVQFGPGALVSVPGQALPIRSAEERPTGLVGASFGITQHLSLDVDATRSAITYTPVSTRLGIMRNRLLGRVNYFFNARTGFHLAYWHGRYSSEEYTHTRVVNNVTETATLADHDQANGGSIIFNRTLVQSDHFSLEGGYEGVMYGFSGSSRNVFLGFFTPAFYQVHELVPRVYGTLWGPFGYDVSGGIGIQQTNHGGAVTRAWNVSPNLSIRVSRHLQLIFGYTHYNTAEALGPLRGNAVRFVTEWQY